jgi:hypothetical protein
MVAFTHINTFNQPAHSHHTVSTHRQSCFNPLHPSQRKSTGSHLIDAPKTSTGRRQGFCDQSVSTVYPKTSGFAEEKPATQKALVVEILDVRKIADSKIRDCKNLRSPEFGTARIRDCQNSRLPEFGTRRIRDSQNSGHAEFATRRFREESVRKKNIMINHEQSSIENLS